MSDKIVRLGLICTEGGGEYEYFVYAERTGFRVRPYVVCARTYGGDEAHDPAHLRETARIDLLETTAKALAPLKPQSCLWACTSGSFIRGRAYAEAQADAIGRVAGCPASSTSLAFAHALESMALRRVAVLATYPDSTAQAFRSFLGEFGFEVVAMKALGIPDGPAAFLTPSETLAEAARAADSPGAEALLIPDTAVAACALIAPLERALKKPVLVANQVTLWEGLRLAGARERASGYGRLMAA